MKSHPKTPSQEVLAGLVERVTFHNEDKGFCVLRARARGHRDLVTVVGQAAAISAGEWITASGEWVNDRTLDRALSEQFIAPSSAVLASRHEQPVPVFQQLARGHPPGRDDVREIPAVAPQR
jgi:hypothetical protein